jgi:S1-C subfamily serine protease
MRNKHAGWIFLVAGAFFSLGWSLQRWSVDSAAPVAPQPETVSDPWAGSIDLSMNAASLPPRDLHFTQLAGPQLGQPNPAPLPAIPGQAQPVIAGPIIPRPAQGGPPIDLRDFSPEEQSNIAVYEQYNRSVVNISTKTPNQGMQLFGESIQEGAGSGSVIDLAGHILTNNHVVEGAREIEVTLADGKSYEATIVGTDPPNDMAVIKITAPAGSLIPIPFGDSSLLRVGQRVLAIGNPFGLERTLTTGIVSSLNRSIPTRNGRTIKSIIQIDAAINPGNSGGPLLDGRGRLIGMNTAIASRSGQSAGVGFAIPVNNIARVVPQLIKNGKIIRPETGISRVFQTDRGLLIATLAPNGPAQAAGLRGIQVVRQKKQRGPFIYETETLDRSKADLIVGVNGTPIKTADDFLTTIEMHQPGEEVTINVIREGREAAVKLRLVGGE